MTLTELMVVKGKYEIKLRQIGNIATCYTKLKRYKEELGRIAKLDIDDICRDIHNLAKISMK